MSTDDGTLISHLLETWHATRVAGREVPLTDLCADHPHLLSELERRAELLRQAQPDPATFSLSDTAPTRAAPAAPAKPGPKPGDTFGPLVLVRMLGSGGMGEVWEAIEPALPRRVAVKIMRPDLAGNPAVAARFVREMRALAAVTHPHVVPLHTIGEHDGVPYFVMALLLGRTLSSRLKREGVLPAAEVLRIARQVAEGLEAAHRQGLTHRDVKPGNVWLNAADGSVVLLDFGIARLPDLGSPDDPITATGMVLGTPAYMAPEQAAGKPVDARADLFSLGVMMYELSTGVHPFRNESVYSTLTALAVSTPPTPTAVRPEVPAALAELIDRLMAKDPADRWPTTAAEVAAVLARLEASLDADVFPPRPRAKPAPRRRPWVAVVALLLLLPVAFLLGREYLAPVPKPRPAPAPMSAEDRVRELVGRLQEQSVASSRTEEVGGGVAGFVRVHEHQFHGSTGVPVWGLGEVNGRPAAEIKVPYSGQYHRESWVKGVPKNLQPLVRESKPVSGTVVVRLAGTADGWRMTDYAQTETGGEVLDHRHNAQVSAKEAVVKLLHELIPER